MPRPVEPALVPLPEVDRRAFARTVDGDRQRVARLGGAPLPFDVRAVGELVRAHGAALSDPVRAGEARSDAALLARAALAQHGAEALLTLRALQTDLFLSAVERWQASGRIDTELRELGGTFPEKCKSSGWLDAEGRLTLTDSEQRVLFKVRWSDITGTLEQRDLRPSLDEFRLYYAILLERPGGETALEQDERRLAAARALTRIDGDFPGDLASGVLGYRLGRVDFAYAALRAHVTAHPDGPWALRAKNYALYLATALPPEE